MKGAKLVGIFISLFIFFVKAFAAYPLGTDDAGVVNINSYEIEAGYDECKDEENLNNKSCGVSLKHGVTEKMDLGLYLPYRISPMDSENLGAAVVSIKFSLMKDIIAFTFSNEVGEKEYGLNAIGSYKYNSIKYNINAGYVSTGDANVRGFGTYGISMELPICRIHLVSEILGQEGGNAEYLVGCRYFILDTIFAAFGLSRSFRVDANRYTVGFHLEF